MRDLTEDPDDIEIHVSFTRDELENLVDDMNHYGLADVTADLVALFKKKLA
jgi:hypothetical protein